MPLIPIIQKSGNAALILVFLTSSPAYALNCTSKDTSQLKTLYKAYVISGTTPQGKIDNHSTLGTAVTANGTVTGIIEYQPCWKESPACTIPAQYDSAHITFVTSAVEVKKVFSGNPNNALLDCFRKLGLGAQEKRSGILNGIFR